MVDIRQNDFCNFRFFCDNDRFSNWGISFLKFIFVLWIRIFFCLFFWLLGISSIDVVFVVVLLFELLQLLFLFLLQSVEIFELIVLLDISLLLRVDERKPLAEGIAFVRTEETEDTLVTEITSTEFLGFLERVNLRISQLTVFSTLQIDDHAVTLGILPSEMREGLTQLRFLTHVTIDNVTSVIVVLLEITLHEIFN